MTISGSGSGGNCTAEVPNQVATDFVGVNCTNEVRLPSEKALSVLFGAVASAVVVLAVVLVVVTIVCQRRRRGTKADYSFTKTVTIQPRGESIRSNAPVLDLRQDQLGRSVEGGESVAMVETVSQSPCTELPSEVTAESFKKGCLPVAASKSQFSFEDGTSLHDYPASVDLEVSGKDEGEPVRANIMGYCDIYSSQILALSTEDTTPVNREQSLRPAPSPHSSGRRLKRRLPAAPATPHVTESVVSQGLVTQRPRSNPNLHGTEPLPTSLSPDMTEVEKWLNQSLTDVLEMTRAMAQETGASYNDTTQTSEHGSSTQPKHNTMRRQGSSLPSLLDTTPTPSQQQHLTSSSPATLPAPSVGASHRGGTLDPPQVMTPASPRVPQPQTNTLLCSDEMTELHISHV